MISTEALASGGRVVLTRREGEGGGEPKGREGEEAEEGEGVHEWKSRATLGCQRLQAART